MPSLAGRNTKNSAVAPYANRAWLFWGIVRPPAAVVVAAHATGVVGGWHLVVVADQTMVGKSLRRPIEPHAAQGRS